MKNLRSITTLLVCIAVLFSFFVSIIRVFGFRIYGVLTGSMEPAYPTGSLIYVRDVNPDDLRIGDAITFSLSPNVIATHRIVGIVPDENNPTYRRFQTKGDANRSVDASLVAPANIIGKVAFSLPYLGTIANYIQNPPGIYVAILVSGALIVLVFLTDSSTGKKLPFLNKKGKQQAADMQPVAAGMPPVQQNPYPVQMPTAGVQQPHSAYPQQQFYAGEPVRTYPGQQAVNQPQYRAQQPYGGYPQPRQMPEQYPQQQVYPQYRQPQNGGYPQQGTGYSQSRHPQQAVLPGQIRNGGNPFPQPPQYANQADPYPSVPQPGSETPRRRRSGTHQA